jgi:hypothetical protein
LLIISLVGDFLWIFFVGLIRWNQDANTSETNNQLHQLTRILSIVNIVYKIALIIYAVLKIRACATALTLKTLEEEISGKIHVKHY